MLLLAGTAGQLQAALKEPALQAELQAAAPEDEIRVIVEFAQRPDLQSLRSMPRPQRRASMATDMKATAESDQRVVRSLLQNRGVRGIRHLWMINSLVIFPLMMPMFFDQVFFMEGGELSNSLLWVA